MQQPPAALSPAAPVAFNGAIAASGARRLLAVSFGVLLVGVQIAEALALVGAGALVAAFAWELSRTGGWRGLGAALRPFAVVGVLVAWGLLCTAAGEGALNSAVLARQLDWLLLPIFALAWARVDEGARRTLLWFAFGTFLVSCAVAGLQYFGAWPAPEAFASLAWTKAPFHRVYEQVPGADGRFMGGGLLLHRLKFSHVGAFAVLAALVVGLRSAGSRRVLALAVAVAGLGALLVFPHARAAVGALFGAAVVVLLCERRNRRVALAVGAALAVLAVAAVGLHASFRERMLGSLSSAGSGDRGSLLSAGWAAARAHPMLGTGVGRFRVGDWAPGGATAHVLEHRGKAHNMFLSAAAETGVPGALLLVAALALLARRLRPSTIEGAVGVGAVAFVVLLGMTHDPLFHAEVSMAFMLAVGVASAPGPTPHPQPLSP